MYYGGGAPLHPRLMGCGICHYCRGSISFNFYVRCSVLYSYVLFYFVYRSSLWLHFWLCHLSIVFMLASWKYFVLLFFLSHILCIWFRIPLLKDMWVKFVFLPTQEVLSFSRGLSDLCVCFQNWCVSFLTLTVFDASLLFLFLSSC